MSFYNVSNPARFLVKKGFDSPWQDQPKTNLTVPAGAISQFAGSVCPEGYLFCDGRPVSRTLYNVLFYAIGTTYGVGDGTTTFNLPDFRTRVPLGLDLDIPSFNTLNNQGGEIAHTLTVNEMPSHNHGGSTSINGSHIHSLNNATTVQKTGNNTVTSLDSSAGEIDNVNVLTASVVASGDHSHTISSQGGGLSHNNLQPYLVVNYIIKC